MEIVDAGNNARLVRQRPWIIAVGLAAAGALLDLFSGGILQGAGTLQASTVLGVP